MDTSYIADKFAKLLSSRAEVRLRRLRASLAAESGDSLIEQGEGLQRTRRNLYWIGGVVLLLLLARPEDGKAEISLFASLTLPIYPLLIGLLLYLGLALFQFRQELWRETLRHNTVSKGRNRIGELERVTDEVIKRLKVTQQNIGSWQASMNANSGWVDSASKTLTRLRSLIERFERAQKDLPQWPSTNHRSDALFACTEASSALRQFLDEFGALDADQHDVKLDKAIESNTMLMKALEVTRDAIRVETDSFFTLSSDLKFRERLVFILVDSLLPTLFAFGAIVAGINYLLVPIMAQPIHTFEEPWCPVCPVSQVAGTV